MIEFNMIIRQWYKELLLIHNSSESHTQTSILDPVNLSVSKTIITIGEIQVQSQVYLLPLQKM